MKEIIKEFLSIQEKKISTLLISFVVVVGYCVYTVHTLGDIPTGLLGLAQAITLGVVGVNGITALQQYAEFKSNLSMLSKEKNDEYN